MSTLASQHVPLPSWKEEVNRRLAAHQRRKGLAVVDPELPAAEHTAASARAAEAAARVAARYAKAPSYSEMQAAEARAALRAAEAVTHAALEAQAAAQAVVASLELREHQPSPCVEPEEPWIAGQEQAATLEPTVEPEWTASQALEVRWEPDLPALRATVSGAERYGTSRQRIEAVRSGMPDRTAQSSSFADEEVIREVEAAQPIPANLIQFPPELVATRRMRPRMTGNRHDALGEMFGQLSIFEVDPSTISIDPPQAEAQTEQAADVWRAPEWSGIEFEDTPQEPDAAFEDGAALVPRLELAPLQFRLIANLVDTALIIGMVTALAATVAGTLSHLPGIRVSELAAMGAVLLVGVVYHWASFSLLGVTPGMKFAGIAPCTFEGEHPTRAQLHRRLGAMLLSLLPLGLGAVWAVFDEDHLCWHNRLSRTYLRQCQPGAAEGPVDSQ